MTADDLIAHLDGLSAALGDGVDLGAILAVLVDDLMAAVPSFLEVRLALPLPVSDPVVVTSSSSPGAPVCASLRLPLDRLGIGPPGATITYYAAQPGAFHDLAAAARRDYDLGGNVEVDRHLHPLTEPGFTGLDGHDSINQAIGVLIHHGHTPDEAVRLIARHAATTGRTPVGAALDLIESPVPAAGD